MGYKYPRFCHGPCMTLSKSASGKLYKTASTHQWNGFHLEDVLFNGVFRSLAKINSIHLFNGYCEHKVYSV